MAHLNFCSVVVVVHPRVFFFFFTSASYFKLFYNQAANCNVVTRHPKKTGFYFINNESLDKTKLSL